MKIEVEIELHTETKWKDTLPATTPKVLPFIS